MSDDILWQIFAETGDPMSWLMHRASEKQREKQENKTTSAEECPSPED